MIVVGRMLVGIDNLAMTTFPNVPLGHVIMYVEIHENKGIVEKKVM